MWLADGQRACGGVGNYPDRRANYPDNYPDRLPDYPRNPSNHPRTTQEIPVSTQERGQSPTEKILGALRDNPELTLAELARQLGMSRDGVKYQVVQVVTLHPQSKSVPVREAVFLVFNVDIPSASHPSESAQRHSGIPLTPPSRAPAVGARLL
ncbi:MAG: winged helix-turn-helix domain-containing protein [Kiritimatiellae bacterium]|nr:winged helix-turn-helix domain-containing protein [Kiritimatiellia bacterium]